MIEIVDGAGLRRPGPGLPPLSPETVTLEDILTALLKRPGISRVMFEASRVRALFHGQWIATEIEEGETLTDAATSLLDSLTGRQKWPWPDIVPPPVQE